MNDVLIFDNVSMSFYDLKNETNVLENLSIIIKNHIEQKPGYEKIPLEIYIPKFMKGMIF